MSRRKMVACGFALIIEESTISPSKISIPFEDRRVVGSAKESKLVFKDRLGVGLSSDSNFRR